MRRAAGILPVLALMMLTPLAATAANTGATIVSCSTATACYSPNPIRITAGSSVSWTNNHSFAHTATADGGAWDTGSIPAGGSSGAVTFNTPGTFAYHCRFHADMHGTIIVAAVTVTPSATVSPGVTSTAAPTHAPVRRLPQSGGGLGASIVLLPIALALLLAGTLLLAARPRRTAPARESRREASGEDPR